MFVAHERVAPGAVLRRDYQIAIAAECVKRNTLVILPTGLGKTVVALLVVAERVRTVPGQILFLAPTKPLVEQHAAFLRAAFVGGKVEILTGETSPDERALLWKEAAVLCATPQVVQNDLVSGNAHLRETTLVVFDEAHRATGNYAYAFIAEQFRRHRLNGLILGMTASPGADPGRVREVCKALAIEGVEVRTPFDADTAPYLQDTALERVEIQMPESLRQASALLKRILDEKVELLKKVGALQGRYASRKELLLAQARLQARMRESPGDAPRELWEALSAQAAALKLTHGLELVETQGVAAFDAYCERLSADETKAARSIREDLRFLEARAILAASRADHPKMRKTFFLVRDQIRAKPDAKVIVFTNYRDVSEALTKALGEADAAIKPVRFVGQQTKGGDKGLSQKEQVRILDRFRGGEFNVLVATSVAEEGLDIPSTDLVVFYEPVASEIRAIQRRGRTGRNAPGRVVVLVTKGTRDETLLYASANKEKKMRREVDTLKAFFAHVNASEKSEEWKSAFLTAEVDAEARPKEKPLTAFVEPVDRVELVVDHREFAGAVARELARLDVLVRPETLEVADYVASDRVAVERKTSDDFEASLMDGRLFTQIRALKDAYPNPILVVEGGFSASRISPEALLGAIASLAADYRVPVVTTKDAAETARLLAALAKREQKDERRAIAIRHGKGALTDEDRLRFLVEGLPEVSAVLARRLLARFGTVRALANATVEELREVEGIGKQRAADIVRVLTTRSREAAAAPEGPTLRASDPGAVPKRREKKGSAGGSA